MTFEILPPPERMAKLHPLAIVVIVIWCAMAVISQNEIAMQNEAAAQAPEAEGAPEEAEE